MGMDTGTGLRAAGIWIAIGALCFVVGLGIHGAQEETTAAQMAAIADSGTWTLSHWLIGGGMMALAAGAVTMLASGSKWTDGTMSTMAWGAVALFAIPMALGMALEATVVSEAAVAGSTPQYEMWSTVVVAMINALALVLVGLLVVAWDQFRADDPVTPKWASGIAAVLYLVAFVAFAGSTWFDIAAMMPVAIIGSAIAGLWLLWLGLGMARPAAAGGAATSTPSM